MDLRLAILELTARHQLSADAARRLAELAGLNQQPQRLVHSAARGLAVLAAVLGGLGIIFWIAANWESLSRAGRFALLESFFCVMCAGAILRPIARVPLSLIALLVIGGLLAFFGQTYQTGADPWQLFAWWALLALPLCLGARHDALWIAWSIVVMTALALWTQVHSEGGWTNVVVTIHQLFHWCGALLLTIALGPALQKYTGAGIWTFRTCILLTTITIAFGAVLHLFNDSPIYYYVGLFCLGGLLATFSRPVFHDTFALSTVGLGLNLLIDTGVAKSIISSRHLDSSGFLVVGLVAALALALTVAFILKCSRNMAPEGSTQ